MTKIEIKTMWGEVIFTYEKDNNTVKDTVVEAVKHGAYLGGAYLGEAYLHGADLRGAYLRGAYLGGADLGGANLRGADLGGADLGGADLGGAYLRGADLGEANLRGADLGEAYLGGADLRGADLGGADLGEEWGKLEKNADVFVAGPLGSRSDYTTFFHTDKGIFVQCGCFSGTIDEFVLKVKETHSDNKHAKNYLAIVEFVRQKYQ